MEEEISGELKEDRSVQGIEIILTSTISPKMKGEHVWSQRAKEPCVKGIVHDRDIYFHTVNKVAPMIIAQYTQTHG